MSIEYYNSFGTHADKTILKGVKQIANRLQANTYLVFKETRIQAQNNSTANCGLFAAKFIIDRLGRHKSFAQATGFDDRIKNESAKGERSIAKFKKQVGFGSPWQYVKSFGAKTFQKVSNAYRSAYLKLHPEANVRMLDEGEYHYGLHNYTGPGTQLSDKNRNVKPFNNIDAASRTHDLDYEEAGKIANADDRARAVHEADKKAIAEYNKHKGESGYLPAVIGIGGKYLLEKALSKIKGKPTTLYGGRKRKSKYRL